VSVRFALLSLRKSISIWWAHHSNHTTISGHNNATFRKSYITLSNFFFLFFSELYSFSFFCFWILMYMYNIVLRFEKKKYSAIYEHDVFTVNIYFFMRISRVLCFFKHFLWFKLYKSDQFQFIISDFQSALNKAMIAMLTFIIRSVFLTLFL
jgi:hypothetical protein